MRKKRIFQVRNNRQNNKRRVLKLIILSEIYEEEKKITINEQRRRGQEKRFVWGFFSIVHKTKMIPIDWQTDKNKKRKKSFI
jgi:hypothetical protein